MDAKGKLLRIVENARGGNLERAEMAFHGLSPEQMQEEHGFSNRTCQEVLDGYRRERKEWQAAKELLAELLEKDCW